MVAPVQEGHYSPTGMPEPPEAEEPAFKQDNPPAADPASERGTAHKTAATLKPSTRERVASVRSMNGTSGQRSRTMPTHDAYVSGLRLPNTLDVSDRHTALVVGHLLRAAYAELLNEDQPTGLMTLVDRLEARERAVVHASQR